MSYMAENNSYKNLSNDDFYKLLKSRESDASWTLGQIIEYQRRGSRAFDHDIQLVTKLDKYVEKQNQKYSQILQPYKDLVSTALAGSLTQSTKHILDAYTAQNERLAALLPKIQAPKLDFSSNVFQDLAKIDPHVIERPLSSSGFQKVIVEGLAEMSDSHGNYLEKIADNTKWDWKQWTLFGLAGVAAVASILALFR